jgi:two-component system response regulator YesN
MTPPGHPSRARPTILLVEDDRALRGLLVRALEDHVDVLEAEDGQRAVELLEERRGEGLGLLLVDVLLPKRSGLEVVHLSRRMWPWIPAVIITGAGSEDLAVEALRAGVRDYLKKPISLGQLTETIDALITKTPPASRESRPEPRRLLHPAVLRAVEFAEEHFCEDITLDLVARRAALSKFHLCRLFRQETGSGLRDYLRRLRIARAKILLASTRSTVTEVAYAVGFNDLAHFDKVFARIVGVTPTDYRRSLGPARPEQ